MGVKPLSVKNLKPQSSSHVSACQHGNLTPANRHRDTSRLYQKPGLKAAKISMNFEREIGENPCLACEHSVSQWWYERKGGFVSTADSRGRSSQAYSFYTAFSAFQEGVPDCHSPNINKIKQRSVKTDRKSLVIELASKVFVYTKPYLLGDYPLIPHTHH